MPRLTIEAQAYEQRKAEHLLAAARDDLPAPTDWRTPSLPTSATEHIGPAATYTAHVSPIRHVEAFAADISDVLGEYGAQVTAETGVWAGELEPGAAITFQGPVEKFAAVLAHLAKFYPVLRMVHVEVTHPEVTYVDLNDWRK